MSISIQCRTCGRQFRASEKYVGERVRCPNCGREIVISQQRVGTHDVFISYSKSDKATADALCSALESNGLRCWIAPRDVLPGADWGEAIIGAIEQGRLMVLVLTAESNTSLQVKREVERAASKGVAIISVRIEDVPLSKSMEFFISNQQWFDALTPPLKYHLDRLAEVIHSMLKDEVAPRHSPSDIQRPPTAADGQTAQKGLGSSVITRPALLIAAGAGMLAVLMASVLAFGLWLGSDPATTQDSRMEPSFAPPPETIGKKTVGTWKLSDHSLDSLKTLLEELARQGRVNSAALMRQYADFRFRVTPMSDPIQFRIEIEVDGKLTSRSTLSVSTDGKRLEGTGTSSVVLEPQPRETLVGQRIPNVHFLDRVWVYERAD